jgi:hypothetical protein
MIQLENYISVLLYLLDFNTVYISKSSIRDESEFKLMKYMRENNIQQNLSIVSPDADLIILLMIYINQTNQKIQTVNILHIDL